jgi:hypothetical protein
MTIQNEQVYLSLFGNVKFTGWEFQDTLDKASTFSFTCIPTWLGMQRNLAD